MEDFQLAFRLFYAWFIRWLDKYVLEFHREYLVLPLSSFIFYYLD